MNDEQQQRRRKRRRQRRAVAVLGFVLLTIGLAWFFESQATTTIIVTRHADASAVASDDPGLSPRGKRRATELSRILGDVDVVAGVDAIFVTSDRLARDTSVPLATLNSAPVHTVDNPDDSEALVQRILQEYKGKIILLITQPDLMQPVIAVMQGSKKLPPIENEEYDNLYIVSIPWFGKVKTLRIRYGDRYVPDA